MTEHNETVQSRQIKTGAAPSTLAGHSIRAVLFDKDGTLFDFRRTWIPVFRAAVRELTAGDPLLADRLLSAAGYDSRSDRYVADGPIAAGNSADIAAAWLPLLQGRQQRELQQWIDNYSVRNGPRYSVPVCDLSPLLERLQRAGLILGLATSDSESAARATLACFGIEARFAWISGYDSGNGVKPDPLMVDNFAAAVGTDCNRVVVVGDTLHDLRMAAGAGAAAAVAVLTGAVEREILIGEADFVIDSIATLPQLMGLAGPGQDYRTDP